MNIAVVFASRTGHSKKVARAVAEKLGVTALDVKDKPVLSKTDLLFLVGGIYADQCSRRLIAFAEGLNGGTVRRAALITTSTSQKKGQDAVREMLMQSDIEVLEDEHMCPGGFLFMKMRRPNKADLEAAAAFAQSTADAVGR